MQIATITTRYDIKEDRIALTVADERGQIRKWLLTRGLTRVLVPALLGQLQAQIQAQPGTPPEHIEAANVYAQLQARVTLKPVRAVKVEPGTAKHLITRIQVDRGPKGSKMLTFFAQGGADTDTLTLGATEARQWVEMIKLAVDQAQWGLDAFPAWIGAGTGAGTTASR